MQASSETIVASYVTAVAVPKGAPKPDISTPAAVKKALLAAKSVGYEDPDFTPQTRTGAASVPLAEIMNFPVYGVGM